MQSEAADNVCWSGYESPTTDHPSPVSDSALLRMEFKHVESPIPLHAIITEARDKTSLPRGKGILIVTGRSRRLAAENHRRELNDLMEEYQSLSPDVMKTIGDVATSFVVSSCGSGIIVLQAAI